MNFRNKCDNGVGEDNFAEAKNLYGSPISSTQDEVLEYMLNIPSGITFIHGKAGCGKTYLIRVSYYLTVRKSG